MWRQHVAAGVSPRSSSKSIGKSHEVATASVVVACYRHFVHFVANQCWAIRYRGLTPGHWGEEDFPPTILTPTPTVSSPESGVDRQITQFDRSVRNELAGSPAVFIRLGIARLLNAYRTANGTFTLGELTITTPPTIFAVAAWNTLSLPAISK